ncbi:MAG: M43 family zinc metalloprotease [Bacteroidia bacterium]
MKKALLTAAALTLCLGGFAQITKRVCGAMQHELYLQSKDPNRAKARADYEKAVQDWITKNAASRTNQSTQAIIQIPLVVHMVYSSSTDSVGDAQIFSQIQILNQDFTRTNPDTTNTPAAFKPVAGAPMVNYCWAQRDPNGNPTNGIERRKSTTTSWTTDDAVKSYSTGGMDAWDPTKYFNIWVCNLGGGLLGYGEFPTASVSNTYGFVAGATCFGNTGLAQAPYDGGRTATHEIGHCFNLAHIWGDDGTACTGSDGCADTPNQAGENYGCPAYPHTDGCSTTAPGVMFMNYMDYTDDACMNIFTQNQSTRMVAIVNTAPYNALASSDGCLPLTLPPNDAGITGVNAPAGTSCVTTVNPSVTLKNWGASTLNTALIQYKIDAGTVMTYTWNGSLASLATTVVALPSMTTTAGSHTFSVNSASPNNNTDGNSANDAATGTFTVVSGVGTPIPYTEDFENTTFPQGGMTLNNPDAATTWQRDTWAHKSGVASAYMDYFNYGATGQYDEMVIPALDFTGGTGTLGMSFQVAYRLYTSPTATLTFSDTLQVVISTDCGATWNSVYKKFSSALTTATPAYSTTSFTPTATQWRSESIDLTPYATSNYAIVKIRGINDYENQMYIDDINISKTNGIKNSAASLGVSVYPNPSADGKFSVDIAHNEANVTRLVVFDMLGNKVYEINDNIPAGNYDMDLSSLGGGTYFVQVVKGNASGYTKIVISK